MVNFQEPLQVEWVICKKLKEDLYVNWLNCENLLAKWLTCMYLYVLG